MTSYSHRVGKTTYSFPSLKSLLAKASPPRAGDRLAGIAAESAEENVAAKLALADVPLSAIVAEPLVAYEDDEVTRLILDGHDSRAFLPISHLTVGEFREFLLSHTTNADLLAKLVPAITPEIAAAVSKSRPGVVATPASVSMRVQKLRLSSVRCATSA